MSCHRKHYDKCVLVYCKVDEMDSQYYIHKEQAYILLLDRLDLQHTNQLGIHSLPHDCLQHTGHLVHMK